MRYEKDWSCYYVFRYAGDNSDKELLSLIKDADKTNKVVFEPGKITITRVYEDYVLNPDGKTVKRASVPLVQTAEKGDWILLSSGEKLHAVSDKVFRVEYAPVKDDKGLWRERKPTKVEPKVSVAPKAEQPKDEKDYVEVKDFYDDDE